MCNRPLTEEDIQQRREQARLRHAQRLATENKTTENQSEISTENSEIAELLLDTEEKTNG